MSSISWENSIFWLIAGSGGAAFAGFFILLAIQPRSIFKWGMLCFGWIWVCLGSLFFLGACQHSPSKGQDLWSDWRMMPGIGFCLVGALLALAGKLADANFQARLAAKPPDDGLRTCERHARFINGFALAGAMLTIAAIAVILKWKGGEGLQSWMLPLLIVICQAPAVLMSFAFLPRCKACGTGRMKIAAWRPARYRCKNCGCTIDTHITIMNKKQ